MGLQAFLDLRRADAVARRRDDVVIPAFEPEVALAVAVAAVAEDAPVTDKLLCGLVGQAEVFEEQHRVGPPDGKITDLASWQDHPFIIDNRNVVPGHGPAHEAGFDVHDFMAVGDDQVDFGLAVELVHGAAEDRLRPFLQRCAEPLAAAANRAQFDTCHRAFDGFRHEFQCGRRQEGVSDPVPRHEVKGGFGVKLGEAPGDHRHPEIERGHEHVEQAADPRPVRRGPEAVAGPGHEVLWHFDPGQVAEQHPMRVHRALGRAFGAAGEDDEGAVVGAGGQRLELIPGRVDKIGPAQGVVRGAVDGNHRRERGQVIAVDQSRSRRAGHEEPGLGGAQAEVERVFAEQLKQRHGDQAGFERAEVRGGGFHPLGQMHADAVSHPRASSGQRIGEAVGQPVEGQKAPLADAAVFLLVDDRDPVRVGLGPEPGCRRADVEGLRDLPLKTAHQLGIGLGGQQGSVRRVYRHGTTLSEFEPLG